MIAETKRLERAGGPGVPEDPTPTATMPEIAGVMQVPDLTTTDTKLETTTEDTGALNASDEGVASQLNPTLHVIQDVFRV